MTDPPFVAIRNSFQDFGKIPSCLTLRQFFFLPEQAGQALLARVLHHKVQFPVLSCQEVQLDHALAVQGPQVLHLSFDACQSVPVEAVQLVVGLYCIAFLAAPRDGHRYYRKCALSDMRHQFQVLQALGR